MPQQVSQPREYKLIVEKDVAIPLRDGDLKRRFNFSREQFH
jgi:hypothetical protein